MKTKKCKVLKVNDKTTIEEEDEKEPAKNEESIINSARVLQHVKFECLISKEISEQEQETLRAFCRSGDQEEKAENLIEKIVLAVLNAVVTKNDFVRQLAVPGELRMFAVDEKKAKLPMMALL
uniref:MAGE domain-containing protein n=1 Tax=Caenorhabditis tropicalis TaxID=1561998 RepID=A0A1I7SYL2_9PELO